MAAGRIKGITIEIGANTTNLTKALSKVDSALSKTKNNLRDLERALRLDPGNTELLKDKQQELARAIDETKSRIHTEKEAYEQLKNADPTDENIEKMRQLKTQIDLDTAALKELENEAKQSASVLGTQMQLAGQKIQEVGNKIKGVGDKLQSIGSNLTAKVTVPIVGGLAACTKSAIDFEDAMAKVNTIADTSETGVAIEDLADQIKRLSDETGIASAEIADNVYNAISAGQETGDAVNFVGEATKLAVAGFAESGDALDILTTIMNAYKLEAEDVTRVSDVLINTQNLGKTTVGELASAMGKVIPTAKANGVEIEDLAGAYAIMTANGIATAETTTYLNSMLNELGKQGSTAYKAFAEGTEHIKEGGLTMQEAMESGWELTDVLSILDEQAYASGTSIANMFGSAEAGKAANVLWDNASKLNDAVDSMRESAGATDEAFAKMDTTSRQAQIALNQLKNSAIELGNTVITMLAPYFGQLVEKIKELTTWFNGLDESQQQTIVKIAALVAAIGPALIIVGKVVSSVANILIFGGKLISGIGSLITSLGGLSGVMAVITGPIGIVIAAVAALTAAFVYFYQTNEEFREKVNSVFEQIKEGIGVFIEQVKAWFQEFMEFCQPIFESFQAFGTALCEFFVALVPVIMGIFQNIQTVITTFVEQHKTEIEFVLNFIKELVSANFDIIRTYIKTVLDVITNIIRAFTAVLKGDWSGALNYLKQAAESAQKGLVNIFKRLGEMLRNIFTDLVNKMKQWGSEMIDGLINGIKNKISEVKTVVGGVAEAIASFIHFSEPDVGPLSNFHTFAPDMMALFAQGIRDNAGLITDAIGSSFDLRPYFTTMNNGINKLTSVANSSLDARSQQGPVVVNISLEGDAQRLFRVLSEEARKDWQVTGQSRLMGY